MFLQAVSNIPEKIKLEEKIKNPNKTQYTVIHALIWIEQGGVLSEEKPEHLTRCFFPISILSALVEAHTLINEVFL